MFLKFTIFLNYGKHLDILLYKICIWLLLQCIKHLSSAVHKSLQQFVINIIINNID